MDTFTTVDAHAHGDVDGFELVQGSPRAANHEETAGGVVGDGVAEGDVPPGDAAVDDLEGRRNVGDGTTYRLGVERSFVQVPAQDEGDLDLRLEQPPHRHGPLLRALHVGEEDTEVGPVDAELGMNGRGRQTDLPADDGGAVCETGGGQALLNGVGSAHVGASDQVTDRRARLSARCGMHEPVDGGLDCVGPGSRVGVREGHGRNRDPSACSAATVEFR